MLENRQQWTIIFFIVLYFMRDSICSIFHRKRDKEREIKRTHGLVGQNLIVTCRLASLKNLGAAKHLDSSNSCSHLNGFTLFGSYVKGSPSLSEFRVHWVQTPFNSGYQSSDQLFSIVGQPTHSVTQICKHIMNEMVI